MNFKEIEVKHRADGISLEKFDSFCRERQNFKKVIASGYDHFYSSPKQPDSFCRHRVGPDMNQLTFKRKNSNKNNYIRTEHNIDLDVSVTKNQIEALTSEFGYKFNFSLFKTCFVYMYPKHIFVFYVCYDTAMKELGRFVEIEAKEDFSWESDTEAWDYIIGLEKELARFGVSAQSRIKRSLFEMYSNES